MNFGRYQVLKELGRGAVGVVYLAHDPNLDLPVALKVLRTDRELPEPFVKRFLAEARALGRLEHPSIVRVFNVDEDQGTVFIAMEFVEGASLGDLMREKRFSPREIADVGIAVAEGLEDAHRKGIVHRDIKPSNILVRKDGRVKITDFGIAHIEDASSHTMTQAGEVLGTPAYMSPEQVLGKPADARSDLFSLGIILYEMAAGRRPFGGDTLGAVFGAITRDDPAPIETLNLDVPADLSRVIMTCLAKEPEGRHPSAKALAAALQGCLEERKPAAKPPAPAPKRPRAGLVASIAVLALAAVGGVAYHFYSRDAASPPAANKDAVPPVRPGDRPGSATPGTAFLDIGSAPPGARIFIDGSYKGETPARMGVPPGKRELRLTMPDHHDWEAQVEAAEGADTPVSVRLLPREEQGAKKAEPRAPPARRAPEKTKEPERAGTGPAAEGDARAKAATAKARPAPIDLSKLEGDINRALRNAGLRGVTAEVGDDLVVTLKGSIGSAAEKSRAFALAETFKDRGVRRIKDGIFVVEQ